MSYSHHDADVVRPLISALTAQGIDVWFDENLAPGVDWNEELARVIEDCNVCLFIVSRHSLVSTVCEREVSFAVRKNRQVIPIYLEDVPLSPRLEFEIGHLQAIHVTKRKLTPAADQIKARIEEYLNTDIANTVNPQTQEPVRRTQVIHQHTPVSVTHRRALIVLPAILLMTIGVTYWYLNTVAAPVRIAVLAFENFSGAPNNDYLGYGIAEEVLDGLAQIEGLTVIPRTASFYFKDSEKSFKEITQALNVDAILEGSLISRSGDRIRIAAQLIDTQSQNHHWSQIYDVDLVDLHSVKGKITAQIVSTLIPQAQAQTTPIPVIPAAYDYYLQAKNYLYIATSVAEKTIARDLFAKALVIDPSYHPALAGQCKAELDIYVDTRAAPDYTRAVSTCVEAAAIEDPSAEVDLALGDLNRHAGKCVTAKELYRTAIEKNHKLEPAYYGLARCYENEQDYQRAEQVLQTRIDLERRNWQTYFGYAGFLYRQGRYAESAAQSQKILDLNPDNSYAWSNLATASFAADNWDTAANAWEKALALKPDAYSYIGVATVHYYNHDFQQAVTLLQQALTTLPDHYRIRGKLAAALRERSHTEPATDNPYAEHFARAIELAEAAIAINPKDAQVLGYLASYYANQGLFEKADSTIKNALAVVSNDPETHYLHAVVLLLQGNTEGAGNALTQAETLGYSKRQIAQDPLFKRLELVLHVGT